MKRFAEMFILLTGILLTTQTTAAQEWSQPWARERIAKSPRHNEWVSIKHDGRSVETLVVYPESK
jgi:carboxymethylenebutenolidase